MTKNLKLPDVIYSDLLISSEELSHMAKKPVSLPMTISILNAIYHAHISEPCARDALCQRLSNTKIMSPDEFNKYWNEPAETRQSKYNKSRPKSSKV